MAKVTYIVRTSTQLNFNNNEIKSYKPKNENLTIVSRFQHNNY